MLKRLFSSTPLIRLNCIDCKLYNRKTNLCKINNLNAINNRMDDNICGTEGKKFLSLDKTNLIKSMESTKYSNISGTLFVASLPIVVYCDVYFAWFPLYSFMIASIFRDVSRDYNEKYLKDNDISDS